MGGPERHVLFLGIASQLGIRLHLRQLGHTFGKVGTDLLDVGVGGVDGIEPILDEHLDILGCLREAVRPDAASAPWSADCLPSMRAFGAASC